MPALTEANGITDLTTLIFIALMFAVIFGVGFYMLGLKIAKIRKGKRAAT